MGGSVYSPLRYPGGKSKLYPSILNILNRNNIDNPIYVEPFAGGCSLGLELLLNKKVSSIIINDFDYTIYCFWYSILNNYDEFIELIKNTEITINEWHKQKHIYMNSNNYDKLHIGFATFFLNRTNRSGIIAAGPIGGKSQNGNYLIDCRFNKQRLIDKITNIYKYKKNIKIFNLDAEKLVKKLSKSKNIDSMFIYLDPPYVDKGPCLYKNSYDIEDHYSLMKSINKYINSYKWIITYDKNDTIKNIYNSYKKIEFSLSYSAGNNKKGEEILIFNDLDILKEDIMGKQKVWL